MPKKMSEDRENIPKRKKEHIELCLTDKVAFRNKTNGFDRYEFPHYAATEVEIEKISFKSSFLGKNIDYPFLISCMTGGTMEAENINARLAIAASNLNIPLGVGSQRQTLDNNSHINSYKIIRRNAPSVPVLGNLGAAQVSKFESADKIKKMIDMIEADAFVIHLNPLQELVQKNGETDFKGLLKAIERLSRELPVPLIAKEVGAGIGKSAAKALLDAGVKGIDVAGAGGTSWSAVELLRNRELEDIYFWDWGLPTSYCLTKVRKLKKRYDFLLIGSGGINSGYEAAMALAMGADMAASARIILQTLENKGTEGVEYLVHDWFQVVRKIMYLTGCSTLEEFRKIKLLKKKDLF